MSSELSSTLLSARFESLQVELLATEAQEQTSHAVRMYRTGLHAALSGTAHLLNYRASKELERSQAGEIVLKRCEEEQLRSLIQMTEVCLAGKNMMCFSGVQAKVEDLVKKIYIAACEGRAVDCPEMKELKVMVREPMFATKEYGDLDLYRFSSDLALSLCTSDIAALRAMSVYAEGRFDYSAWKQEAAKNAWQGICSLGMELSTIAGSLPAIENSTALLSQPTLSAFQRLHDTAKSIANQLRIAAMNLSGSPLFQELPEASRAYVDRLKATADLPALIPLLDTSLMQGQHVAASHLESIPPKEGKKRRKRKE